MTATSPTGVSMHDLLASCEAAKTVSCPPRDPEARPQARGRAEHPATAAGARPATANPQPPDGTSRHGG
ncbi:hypothetical protein SRB17_33020 [Streptomyces sp. RB17]|uniref:hypothetical protein n=1 Tax=Streptomyces sp. RB17 TaxID=2585197 RepID=UPI00129585A9|nr:hypothetical protein [Streptomyces sp. RB17]MQY35328.1 hypothetical protein [Streptomyces sp. RB17]